MCVSVRCTLKVMPPIYFHAKYNRYQEHNNTALIEQVFNKAVFFYTVTFIGYAFLLMKLAEMTQFYSHTLLSPLPNCTHIHCLVSLNTRQVLLNINECSFFCMKAFYEMCLLQTHFCVICHFTRLPLSCYL